MTVIVHDRHPIINVIRETWKWPPLKVIVFFEGHIMLEAVLFKIQNTWVSLPHQSYGGLYWKEELITSFSKQHLINKEDFYRTVFFTLSAELSKIESSFKGNKLISYCHSGLEISGEEHLCVNNTPITDPSLCSRMSINEVCQLNIHLYAKSFQSFLNQNFKIKNRLFIRSDRPLSPYTKSHKVISELKLTHSFKNQMTSIPTSVQRKIRKAKRNKITVTLGSIKDLDVFYKRYRKRIHQLGSIGLPKSYFCKLLQEKNQHRIKLFLAWYDYKCIGVAIVMINNSFAENLYFATSKKHNYLYPSYALHARMIECSIENHCEYYSLGRSTLNSGVHHYKQQWGGRDKILYYNYSWKKKNYLWIQKLASFLIPLLPLSFVKLFDDAVSKRYY